MATLKKANIRRISASLAGTRTLRKSVTAQP
jgi:hypothetical protein